MTDLEQIEQLLQDFKIDSETYTYPNTKEITLLKEEDGRDYRVCVFNFSEDGKFTGLSGAD